ncbi:N-acetyltransferase [Exiguobacterium sp. SH0S1]|uniref:GNAT family N-acetyltransferase n=1 Tax=unclassified Exiguobacterium TaxID=2644629 RepID=UPI00103C3F53|nr:MULTISPECIES: GNAT family N-acetyltransferase [unclassified Exiguobacterium]TCI39223.1 N-acetyltransferase [Exiguobacterium sp. SH4S7]TCI77715.1 N-acetyltransferase [Exiguobacterium sp. SH0S1]
MIPTRQTERLVLRSLTQEDLTTYAAILGQREVSRYLGDGKQKTREDAAHLLARFQEQWMEYGYGVWGVVERSTNQLIGHCGFSRLPTGDVELLYAFDPTTWGKGYAVESAQEALEFLDLLAGIGPIIALSYPENERSQRVLVRLGFTYMKEDDYAGVNLLVYQRHTTG